MNRQNNKFSVKKHRAILFMRAGIITMMITCQLNALTRIRDIAHPLGERNNKLCGWGLVVGLNGTGDGGDVLVTARPLLTLLQKLGNPPASLEELKNAKNVALVLVTAELGRNGVRNGDKIDVTITSPIKASSLAGGVLWPAPLQSLGYQDDTVYAWAEGAISIPDPENKTTGIVKGGAQIEVDLLHDFVSYDEKTRRSSFDLVLDDEQSTWQNTHAIAMIIEEMNTAPGVDRGAGYIETGDVSARTALALDCRTVRVFLPQQQAINASNYITRVMDLGIDLPDPDATIVINEKTGTIAITGNVAIASCSVTVSGLVIRIVTPEPQPQPGQPVIKETQWSKFDTVGDNTAKIDDLIAAMDQLNVPIQQKIHAIYALRDAGVLRANVRNK